MNQKTIGSNHNISKNSDMDHHSIDPIHRNSGNPSSQSMNNTFKPSVNDRLQNIMKKMSEKELKS